MKKLYEKPIFTKTLYISIDNIAEASYYTPPLQYTLIYMGGEDVCSCASCPPDTSGDKQVCDCYCV